MTIPEARSALIAWAVGQLGTREGPDNYNRYAAMPEITRLLGWDAQHQPWCNVFVLAAFVSVFGLEMGAAMLYQTVGSGSALCRTSAQFFKDRGAFPRRPEQGDVVFFFVGGEINHMGIVTRVVGGSIVTVEGNSSDMVAERCYSMSDPSIAGYGRPRWKLAAEDPAVGTPAPEEADPELEEPKEAESGDNVHEYEKDARYYELRLPYLSRGSTGETVRTFQILLIGRGFACGPDGADGDFGANTESAARRFQRGHGLKADGIIGPDTASALLGVVFKLNTDSGAELRGKD